MKPAAATAQAERRASTDGAAELESAAFPLFARIVAIGMTLVLALAAARASGQLRSVAWTSSSVWLLAAAWVCIAWLGYWIVHSRTRLVGDTLTQTWIWNKRVRVQDVAQLKLVHWRWVDAIVAPRLLVRHRSGGVLWINASDAHILLGFCEQLARQRADLSSARP